MNPHRTKLSSSMTNPGVQTIYYKSLFKIRNETIQIKIKLDGYSNQCHAIANIYSPDSRKWNEIARIMPDNMNLVRSGTSPYRKDLKKGAFFADEADLLEETNLILGIDND